MRRSWTLSGLLHGGLIVLAMSLIFLTPRLTDGPVLLAAARKSVKIVPRVKELPRESGRPSAEIPFETEITESDPAAYDFEKAKRLLDEMVARRPDLEPVTEERPKGAKYEGRIGGKRLGVCRNYRGRESEDAVISALQWLVRHQGADGAWRATGHSNLCGALPKYPGDCAPYAGSPEFDTGLSALALLAFLGAGYTPHSRETIDGFNFGEATRFGLRYLVSLQDASGRIGSADRAKAMYNHILAAFALSEGYGITGSALLRGPAQRAIDYVVAAQNPGAGWRYEPREGTSDSSVTAWGVMALKSAEISELDFPRRAYRNATAWFDSATDPVTSRVG